MLAMLPILSIPAIFPRSSCQSHETLRALYPRHSRQSLLPWQSVLPVLPIMPIVSFLAFVAFGADWSCWPRYALRPP